MVQTVLNIGKNIHSMEGKEKGDISNKMITRDEINRGNARLSNMEGS